MWEVTSLAGAIIAVLVGMTTLGLMPVCWKVLERRGRCLAHTLLDFSFVSLFGGCGAALLFGSLPRESAEQAADPNARHDIFPQLGTHNGKLVGFALACGACFTFADVFLQQAMPLVGLVTAAAISNALRIIISVLTNYFLDGRLDDGRVLFPGMGLALCAIVCNTAAQDAWGAAEQKLAAEVTKQDMQLCDIKVQPETRPEEINPQHRSADIMAEPSEEQKPPAQSSLSITKDIHTSSGPDHLYEDQATDAPVAPDVVLKLKPKPGDLQDNAVHQQTVPLAGSEATAISYNIMKASDAAMLRGLALSAACGVSYGLYSPAYNIATNDPWNMAGPGAQPMNSWTALLYLYLGLWAASFVINIYLLYHPAAGPPSTLWAYATDWWRDRCTAIYSGIFGLISAIAELIGGQAGGYAFASLVAAYPLVTTVIGICFFKEFRSSAVLTKILLALMFTFYLAAVALIASSARLRSP